MLLSFALVSGGLQNFSNPSVTEPSFLSSPFFFSLIIFPFCQAELSLCWVVLQGAEHPQPLQDLPLLRAVLSPPQPGDVGWEGHREVPSQNTDGNPVVRLFPVFWHPFRLKLQFLGWLAAPSGCWLPDSWPGVLYCSHSLLAKPKTNSPG